jgi:U32 family peptidase
VPTSLLNSLRRAACDALAEQQGRVLPRTVAAPQLVLQQLSSDVTASGQRAAPALHLLVRNSEQLRAARELRPASITLDYLDFDGLRPALEAARNDGIAMRVAAPRMLKPDEQRLIDFLRRLQVPLLVRSSGLLQQLHAAGVSGLHGDFSLNAANHLSADLLLQYGLERLTPTHDLNAAQIRALAERLGAERLEVVAYHHLPVFHTEHCVFCRFLSSGTSYKDCGRPCESHTIALRDSQGRAHPVLADVGCRNTVFGAEAQQAGRHLDSWRAAGIGHLRLEFVHETAEQVQLVTTAFADYCQERISAEQLNRRLQQAAPQGTSEGSLFVPPDHTFIPLF